MELIGFPVALVARATGESQLALAHFLILLPLALVLITKLVDFRSETVLDNLARINGAIIFQGHYVLTKFGIGALIARKARASLVHDRVNLFLLAWHGLGRLMVSVVQGGGFDADEQVFTIVR